jgi:hypothetical protein
MINNTDSTSIALNNTDSTERLGIIVQIGYPSNQFEWRHDPLRSGFVQLSFMQKQKQRDERHRTTVSQMVIIKLYYLSREINYL